MPLYPHQEEASKKALDILINHFMVYLAMEPRAGKTLTSFDIATSYEATNVLFITKKKAINSIARDYSKYPNIAGRPATFDLEIINYASIHKADGKYDLIIIDEAHSVGAYPKPGVRCKTIKKICKGKPIIFLSGTPSPESYSQLYHQFWVSSYSPWRRYRNFYKWAKDYVKVYQRTIKGYQMNQYDRAIETKIQADVSHLFISTTQKQAGFEAQVEERFLKVKAPKVLKDMMGDLQDDWFTTCNGIQVPCNGGGDLVNKLGQLCSGTLILPDDDDGVAISDYKAQFIFDHFAKNKIAILYRYRAEKEIITQFFPNYTESPEEFNERSDKTFICQIQSAREGVDLKTADALIMFNIEYSATSYFQARERTQSRNKKHNTPLYWIFSDTGWEQKVYNAVSRKKNFTWSYYNKAQKTSRRKRREKAAQMSIEDLLTNSQYLM